MLCIMDLAWVGSESTNEYSSANSVIHNLSSYVVYDGKLLITGFAVESSLVLSDPTHTRSII